MKRILLLFAIPVFILAIGCTKEELPFPLVSGSDQHFINKFDERKSTSKLSLSELETIYNNYIERRDAQFHVGINTYDALHENVKSGPQMSFGGYILKSKQKPSEGWLNGGVLTINNCQVSPDETNFYPNTLVCENELGNFFGTEVTFNLAGTNDVLPWERSFVAPKTLHIMDISPDLNRFVSVPENGFNLKWNADPANPYEAIVLFLKWDGLLMDSTSVSESRTNIILLNDDGQELIGPECFEGMPTNAWISGDLWRVQFVVFEDANGREIKLIVSTDAMIDLGKVF